MIMRRGKPLLLPASPMFIWASIVTSLVLNMLINMGGAGRSAWTPDILALTLVFWTVHQPLRVGVGLAFAFGLAMDVHTTSLLGQHALAYTVLGYLATAIHRRLLWFPVLTQMVHVLPLFIATQALVVALRWVAGDAPTDWSAMLAPVFTSALWPLAHVILLAPQHRAHDPDDNRPI